MYVIKKIPEDFVVTEVYEPQVSQEGKHGVYRMWKKNCTTMYAIQELGKALRKPAKDFGFAGNKDKIAVTTQIISIFNPPTKLPEFSHIRLEELGKTNKTVALGALEGNEFILTVRNLEEHDVQKVKEYEQRPFLTPNYFGPQRFSTKNHRVGKYLIQKKFKEAVELILKNEGEFERRIFHYTQKHPTDVIGALRSLPKKLLQLYIAAYQSYLFNTIVHRYLKEGTPQEKTLKAPMIGFGSEIEELDEHIQQITQELLKEEEITLRDFIIPQIPEITVEGNTRRVFFEPKKFRVKETTKDEEHEGKEKVVISFFLDKSCYATTFLDCLLQEGKGILDHLIK